MIEPLREILLNWKVNPSSIEEVTLHPNVYRVKSGSQTFYLKNRKHSTVRKRMEEYRITSFLFKGGLKVEVPVLTQSFLPYVHHREEFHSLYQALEGNPLRSYSLPSLMNVGEYMSHLHQGLSGDMNLPPMEEWRIDTQLREWICSQDGSTIGKWGRGFLGRLEEWSACYRQLPQGIVHSDCHPRNILMKSEKVTGMIDFERIRKAPRIADVGYFLSGVLKDLLQEGDGEYATYIRAFLKGYDSMGVLAPREKKLLPFLVIIFLLNYTFYYHQKGYSDVVSVYIPFIDHLFYMNEFDEVFQI
ncbi:phosphotransferase [Bacillus sp. RO3]|nr:phosphotransferase [Bacillus sp. RO3]